MEVDIARGGIIFLFIACVFFFKRNLEEKARQVFLGTAFLILLVLITFRPESMVDYNQYEHAFISSNFDIRFEPAFLVIKKILSWGGASAICGFFIFALISLAARFSSIYKTGTLAVGCLMIYLTNILIIQDMVAIRAGVAGAFAMLAVQSKVIHNKRKMYIFLLVALMFHYTSAIFLAILFMDNKKNRRIFYLSLIFLSYILSLRGFYFSTLVERITFLEYIFPLFNSYLLEMQYLDNMMNIFNLVQVFHVLICIGLWLYVDKIKSIHPDSLLLLKLYTIGVCCIPLFAQSFNMAIRLSDLLFSVEVLLLPMGLDAIFSRKSLYYILLVLYSSVFLYIRLTDQLYWESVI